MRQRRHGWRLALMVLGISCALGRGMAEDGVLAARLRALPDSVGENRTITRQPGETWVDIGIREHVGFEHLKRANPAGFTNTRTVFIPGRHQVSGLVNDGLVLNLPELMDYRWAGGKVVEWYPISIGRITSRWHTPVGELHIVNKLRNPSWQRPSWAGGGVFPPGPQNPLGDRWMGLSKPGYGLHGTNDPTTIGRTVSHGCIRHFPQHIRTLFEHVEVGTPVMMMYETVTVGQEDGIVYLAVFPDVYAHGTNKPASVRNRLASFGLEQAMSAGTLAQRLRQADGVARPILGSERVVLVDGTVAALTIGPTLRDGTSYLPLREAVEAIGAELSWDAGERVATVTARGRSVTFRDGDGRSFIALDTLFVPVRPLVEPLGMTVGYGDSRLTIETGTAAALPG